MELARYVLRKVDRQTSPTTRRQRPVSPLQRRRRRRQQQQGIPRDEPRKPLLLDRNDKEDGENKKEDPLSSLLSSSLKLRRKIRRMPPPSLSCKDTGNVSVRDRSTTSSSVMKDHQQRQQERHCHRPLPEWSLLEVASLTTTTVTQDEDSNHNTSNGLDDSSFLSSSTSSVSTTLRGNNNNNNKKMATTTTTTTTMAHDDPWLTSSLFCPTLPPVEEETMCQARKMKRSQERKTRKKKKSKHDESKKKDKRREEKTVNDTDRVMEQQHGRFITTGNNKPNNDTSATATTSEASSSSSSSPPTSSSSSSTVVKRTMTKRRKKRMLDPQHEEFREKVAFAFALCRRQGVMKQQQQDDDDDKNGKECCFLPLLDLKLDETNLHTLKRLAKKNADLALHKLHLYQVTFTLHDHFQTFLKIFQRTFPTIERIVLSSTNLQIQDIHAIAQCFENLAELCLYGSGAGSAPPTTTSTSHDAMTEEIYSPVWDDTWCRLTSRVARHVTLPHMGRCLPQGIHRGLSQADCIVERLHLKIDAKEDVQQLVEALCRGRSVRQVRLESAMCEVAWLDELLMQYELLEQLELYQCQNRHKQDDDRLAAWMI